MPLELELQKLGLSAPEAQIYLALLRDGSLGASAVTSTTGIPRSTVYPTLNSLLDRGLVEAEAGYGGRFSAIAAEHALPSLIARAREELLQEVVERERIASELAKQLQALAKPAENNGESELIQVLRDPRVVADRFERLELEAERQIEIFIKAPFFHGGGNPAAEKVLRRGLRVRSLYERAIMDAPEIKPFLSKWIAAGEEARIYEGDLPHKLAIFDRQNILMPLVTPTGQGRTLFIRHPQLATSLGMFFDFLWKDAEPITADVPTRARSSKGLHLRRNKQAKARRGIKSPRVKPEMIKAGRDGNHRQA